MVNRVYQFATPFDVTCFCVCSDGYRPKQINSEEARKLTVNSLYKLSHVVQCWLIRWERVVKSSFGVFKTVGSNFLYRAFC
jgi:hypothetical protein